MATVYSIAGPPPLDQNLQESTAGWKIKRRLRKDTVVEARQRTLEAWHEKWDMVDTGRHIYATIPSIEVNISWKYLMTDHYITHILTGHGPFKTCLLNHEKARHDERNGGVCWTIGCLGLQNAR